MTVPCGTPEETVVAADDEYTIHGQVLNQTDSTKYLGLNIHKSLSWVSHIDKITKKANSTIAFLGRNVMRYIITVWAYARPLCSVCQWSCCSVAVTLLVRW
jgi:hypothetical protein